MSCTKSFSHIRTNACTQASKRVHGQDVMLDNSQGMHIQRLAQTYTHVSSHIQIPSCSVPAVSIQSMSFSWPRDKEKHTLKDVNMELPRGCRYEGLNILCTGHSPALIDFAYVPVFCHVQTQMNFSWNLHPARTIIVGSNGAGKTCLLRCVGKSP